MSSGKSVWRQPWLGRFLQRDPIGIAGGLDVYAYAGGLPTTAVDPGGRLTLTSTQISQATILLAVVYGKARWNGWSPTGGEFLDSVVDWAVSGIAFGAASELAGAAVAEIRCMSLPGWPFGPGPARPPLVPEPPIGGPPSWPPGPWLPVQ